MATITQRLAFLISANADQAIKAFDKTAIAAEKELGKAGKSIDQLGGQLTKFGAAGLAAAGTLGGGLFKLAQGAIEDEKSQALLAEQLRNTADATDAQIASVEKMIDATARATGVADDQLRPAMGNLVRAFGDTEKATSVLGTALDISAATGRDLETVTIALGRAANGNVGALSRLGIPLDENVKKSKDFNAALVALNEQFGGAAAARADTYAGKLDRAKVAISEAGESLGSAFIPFVETSATALANAINALGQFNEKTGGAVGKLAAFGTVGLGAVSTASLVAGQMIKLRDRFGQVDEVTGQLNGKLTTLGKVVAVGSIGIGVAALLYADYTATKAKAEEKTRALADALRAEGDAQKTALAKLLEANPGLAAGIGLVEKLGVKFADLTNKTSSSSKRLDELSKIVSSANVDDLNIDVDKLNSLLGNGANLTRDQAFQLRETVKQLQASKTAIENSTLATEKANEILQQNGAIAVATEEDIKNLTDTYKDFSEAILRNEDRVRQAQVDKLIEEQAKREAEQQERRAKAQKDFADKVDEAAGKLRTKLATALKTAEDNAAAANKAYADYQKNISGSVSGIVDFGEAQATAEENTKNLADAKVKETGAQDALTQALADEAGAVNVVASARTKLAAAQSASIESLDEKGKLKKALDDEAAAIAQVTLARQELADAQNLAEDDPSKTKKVETAESKLTTAIKQQGDATQDVVDIRDSLTEEKTRLIEQAEKDLTRALDEQVGATKAVTDGRKDLAAATNEVLTAEKQPLTFADALAAQVTKAEGFKTDLQKVLDLGGDPALINQLTSAGVDAGSAIMKGILNSSDPKATVGNLVGTLTNVQTFANQIGTSAADTFYGQGVKLANDLLAGVTAGIAAIDVDKLIESKTPLKNIRRAASGFDQSFASFFGAAGLVIPAFADGGIVTKPTIGLVGEAGPEAIIPLNNRSMNQQPSVVNVTINVSGGDPNAVVDALKKYVRANGTLPSAIKLAA